MAERDELEAALKPGDVLRKGGKQARELRTQSWRPGRPRFRAWAKPHRERGQAERCPANAADSIIGKLNVPKIITKWDLGDEKYMRHEGQAETPPP